ncbi:hypothetical protein BDN72DRAFT_840189 [Pluteus cervinus]|uniref:Uncharacterized protein n=1 Tax=Pluteus cervinus TaxID=181527 RepID=A0ACD3AV78_9AGAR|nr:hypothetical protein BDN72DRAFT_840189 [Pluteus cervinus]
MASSHHRCGLRSQIDPRTVQHRFQNSHIPVYRLPTELLTAIFLHARDDAGYHKHSHLVLTLSWVSSHWRDILLSNPALWTFIEVRSEDLLNLFLTRSPNSNLRIDQAADSPNDFVPIMKELFRLECLTLCCPEVDIDEEDELGGSTHDDSLLRPYWSQPAPYLRKLSLTNFPIPPNPFDNISPALRDVELVWCNFDWATFPLSNITTLRVVFPEHDISSSQFLQKLQQMPFLEHLELEGALEGTGWSGPVRHKLSHLKYLDITLDDPNTLMDFLQRISVPAAAYISVGVEESGGMVPELITRLRGCVDGELKALSNFRLDAYANSLSFEVIPVLPASNEQDDHGPFLRGNFSGWEFNHSVVDELFHHYDFSGLTELSLLSDDQEITTDIWTTIFTPLPQLTKLSLEGVFAVSFINHVSTSAQHISLPPDSNIEVDDDIKDEVRQGMTFPSLESLGLHRTSSFVEAVGEDETKWPGEFDMFYAALGIRQLVGCGLRNLKVTRYALADLQVESLRFVVDNLVYEDERSWALEIADVAEKLGLGGDR